jgi:hypothetical protein
MYICIYIYIQMFSKCRENSVVISTGYELDGRGSISGKGKIFFLLHNVQTCSGAHPAFYSMGINDTFPGVKAAIL